MVANGTFEAKCPILAIFGRMPTSGVTKRYKTSTQPPFTVLTICIVVTPKDAVHH